MAAIKFSTNFALFSDSREVSPEKINERSNFLNDIPRRFFFDYRAERSVSNTWHNLIYPKQLDSLKQHDKRWKFYFWAQNIFRWVNTCEHDDIWWHQNVFFTVYNLVDLFVATVWWEHCWLHVPPKGLTDLLHHPTDEKCHKTIKRENPRW